MKNKLIYIGLFLLVISCKNKGDDSLQNAIEGIEQNSKDTIISYEEYIRNNYKVFAMPLPEKIIFCEFEVPINKIHVRDNLDREILVNTYWHSNTFLLQKRAKRWFPIIEKILKQQRVPDDVKYIALIESGLTDVVSPAGAAGFWQFMKQTAEDYGLEINDYVDERYDIEKSTLAACKYMKAAYKEFGSWPLAAASYNIGKGALARSLEKQKVDSYFDLVLNSETSRYVYRILAAKLILENAENFGFNFRPIDTYLPYDTKVIEVDTTIKDLVQFSFDNGINYQILRMLNPWIINYSLPNKKGKTYHILLPKTTKVKEEL